MQYCNHCQVKIRGNKERCPLCKNMLSADNSNGMRIYPQIPLGYDRHLVMRMLVFMSIVALVVSFTVYMLVPADINLPIFTFLGLLSMWLSIILVLRKRNNITKILCGW